MIQISYLFLRRNDDYSLGIFSGFDMVQARISVPKCIAISKSCAPLQVPQTPVRLRPGNHRQVLSAPRMQGTGPQTPKNMDLQFGIPGDAKRAEAVYKLDKGQKDSQRKHHTECRGEGRGAETSALRGMEPLWSCQLPSFSENSSKASQ